MVSSGGRCFGACLCCDAPHSHYSSLRHSTHPLKNEMHFPKGRGGERSGLVCQVRSLNVPRARRPHVCMFHHPRPRQARLSDALGASSAAAHTKRRSRCATAPELPEVQVYRRPSNPSQICSNFTSPRRTPSWSRPSNFIRSASCRRASVANY